VAISSNHYQYNLDLETIARNWRGGCIIRAKILELIRSAYRENRALSSLLLILKLHKKLRSEVMISQSDNRCSSLGNRSTCIFIKPFLF
jgi:6-phosphogluconate dehydrogenase